MLGNVFINAGRDKLLHAQLDLALLCVDCEHQRLDHLPGAKHIAGMIETAVGVENIEAIAAVPGVDCIYIGPGDLAITLGLPPGNDPIPGPHADGIERVRKVASAHGVAVGMPCTTAASALALAERGFSLLAVGADTWWLTDRARQETEALRQAGYLAE